MAETGWPLIPREALPAPVRAARSADTRARIPTGHGSADAARQLAIFGAETTEPSPLDLIGLLAGPGRLGRMGGTARVAVPVDAGWRVHVLVNELVRRGLVVSWHRLAGGKPPADGTAHPVPEGTTGPDRHTAELPAGDEPAEFDPDAVAGGVIGAGGRANDAADTGHDSAGEPPGGAAAVFEVRTAYSRRLDGLARSWPPAAAGLFLGGPGLRLWVAAAGRPREGGYALGLDPDDDPAAVDAALVRAGLAGTVSDDGRSYLILGGKRLARLAELVGERPQEAPAALWPGGVAA